MFVELDMDMANGKWTRARGSPPASFGNLCSLSTLVAMLNKIKRNCYAKKLTGQQQFDFVLSCHAFLPLSTSVGRTVGLSVCLSVYLSVCLPVRLPLTNSFHLPWPIVGKQVGARVSFDAVCDSSRDCYEYISSELTYTYIHMQMHVCVRNMYAVRVCEGSAKNIKIWIVAKNNASFSWLGETLRFLI